MIDQTVSRIQSDRIAAAGRLQIILAFLLLVSIPGSSVSGDDNVNFKTEVMPILTRLGCNSGSCHGAATGRGGFKLSLYGSRPGDDFQAIVRNDKGRRVNRAHPVKSLVLQKPAGELDHGGGQRFDVGDRVAKVIASWIRQGAGFDDELELVKFNVGESPLRFESTEQQHSFKFVATFSNGDSRDVTNLTVLTSNDSSGIQIDNQTNRVTIKRSGRHIVIARFLDRVKPIEFLVPYYAQPTNARWDRGNNFIDDYVYEKLGQLHIASSKPSDDSTFLRRVSLDLTGRLPTEHQIDSFRNDAAADKRKQLIRELLASDAFIDYWTYRLATQLRIRSQNSDKTGARVYHNWLKQQVARNNSWKNIAQALLLSSGDSHEIGAANFYRTTGDARMQAEFVAESLLGIKLRCANCHNHPLDHWTQDDYHGLAAIFAKVKQDRFVRFNQQGENIHAKTGRPAAPRVPGEFFITDGDDDRIPLAAWMLDEGNPYFARSAVNRIWSALLGRGLVEPVDDLRNTNPATHPVLLTKLAEDFVNHNFDIRHTIELICNSDAYQRSTGNPTTPGFHRKFHASAMIRNLQPEVLADAIGDVTGVFDKYPGHDAQTRAVKLHDSRIPSVSLDLLGRCSRDESCESDAQPVFGGLSTKLHLLNGDLINKKIDHADGNLRKLIDAKKTSMEIVRFFYRKAYGREPTAVESRFWIKQLQDDELGNEPIPIDRLEDFVWSILNSREFTTNH